MPGRRMTRQGERESLRRIEESARTTGDFSELVKHYNKLDSNARRRWRYNEVKTVDYKLPNNNVKEKYKGTDPEQREAERAFGYSDGEVIPAPLLTEYWHEEMNGNFHNTIFDNPDDMWQVVGDNLTALLIKGLTKKQRDVVFRRAVRFCPPDEISKCTKKTVRGVNKLYAFAMKRIRSKLAADIQLQMDVGAPAPLYKLRFLEMVQCGMPENPKKAKKKARRRSGRSGGLAL